MHDGLKPGEGGWGGGQKIVSLCSMIFFIKIILNKNCNDPRTDQSLWKGLCGWVGQVFIFG